MVHIKTKLNYYYEKKKKKKERKKYLCSLPKRNQLCGEEGGKQNFVCPNLNAEFLAACW